MKPNLLINLPQGFYRTPALRPIFQRAAGLASIRRRSFDTPEQIAADLAWADAVIMWSWPKLSPQLLAESPQLRFAGHIDLSQIGAKDELDHGLAVSVSRAGFSPAVAEMALTLILNLLRKTSDYHAAMRMGKETWVQSFPDDIDPLERQLAGRSVGIIGFGRIGRRLRELLAPFNCDVRAHDPFVSNEAAAAAGVIKTDLMDLIRNSEIVVLAAAANQGTRHLLGAKQIAALRKNAILVNVARAVLVDTNALVKRLGKGDISAAIDVFDQEPLAKNHPLRKLKNAYLTPHRAGGVMASVERILNYLIDDYELFQQDKPRDYVLVPGMISSLDA